MQLGLLYENGDQKESRPNELLQMESTDDIYYSARDLTQGKSILARKWQHHMISKLLYFNILFTHIFSFSVDSNGNKRFSTLRRSFSYENAMLRPC